MILTKTYSLLLGGDGNGDDDGVGDGDGGDDENDAGDTDNDDGKYLLVPDEDILSAARPVVEQLRLRETESGSRSPATVVSVQCFTISLIL